MSESSEQAPAHRRLTPDENEDHENLDTETIVEDAEELFEPDNRVVPPPQPDAPPPD
jgi:hypothetical protein